MCEAQASIPILGDWALKKKRKARRYSEVSCPVCEGLLHSLRNVSYHFYLQCWHALFFSGENFDLIYDPLTRGISELRVLIAWPGLLKESVLELVIGAGINCWSENILITLWSFHLPRCVEAADLCGSYNRNSLRGVLHVVKANSEHLTEILLFEVLFLPFQPIFLCLFDCWRKEVGNGFPVLVCLVLRKVWFVASVWKTRKKQLLKSLLIWPNNFEEVIWFPSLGVCVWIEACWDGVVKRAPDLSLILCGARSSDWSIWN